MTLNDKAVDEITRLRTYYYHLAPMQQYFFPNQLKLALTHYDESPNAGAVVYRALFGTNWLLKHWPFFFFLGEFSTSAKNHAAQTFRVAHELYHLNNTSYLELKSNYHTEIQYLQQYKNNLTWFSKLFFPTELSRALKNYEQDKKLYPLYEVLVKHTNHWFFQKLRVFKYTPLSHVYSQLEHSCQTLLKENIFTKETLFECIASSPNPIERLELIKSVTAKSDLSEENVVRIIEDAVIWLELNPRLGVQTILALKENASEETCAAIEELVNSNTGKKRIRYIAAALSKLPKELSSDYDCIDAVVNNTHPEQAAIMLHYFHEDNLLDNEENKSTCLNCVQQHFLPLYENGNITFTQKEGFYNCLQSNWIRIQRIDQQKDITLSADDKKNLVKYSQHLFDSQTSALWSAVPDDLLYELYRKAMIICKKSCDYKQYLQHTPRIMALLLQQPAVFNNARVQLDPQYDTYTASMINDIVADPNSTSESRYNALPHLIRRNTEKAGETIITWLDSDPNLADRVCNVKQQEHRSGITIQDFLTCARNYNPMIQHEIMERRFDNPRTGNHNRLFSKDSTAPSTPPVDTIGSLLP